MHVRQHRDEFTTSPPCAPPGWLVLTLGSYSGHLPKLPPRGESRDRGRARRTCERGPSMVTSAMLAPCDGPGAIRHIGGMPPLLHQLRQGEAFPKAPTPHHPAAPEEASGKSPVEPPGRNRINRINGILLHSTGVERRSRGTSEQGASGRQQVASACAWWGSGGGTPAPASCLFLLYVETAEYPLM